MGKANLIKDATLKKIQDFDVEANKDQITVKRKGEKRVLEFTHERLVFYIANGSPACGLLPLRYIGPPPD